MIDKIKVYLEAYTFDLTDEQLTRLLVILTNRVNVYLFGNREDEEIPERLYSVIAEMFNEQYLSQTDEMNGISKLQDGQQSVWYGKMNKRLASGNDDALFSSHVSILNRYRLIGLVG